MTPTISGPHLKLRESSTTCTLKPLIEVYNACGGRIAMLEPRKHAAASVQNLRAHRHTMTFRRPLLTLKRKGWARSSGVISTGSLGDVSSYGFSWSGLSSKDVTSFDRDRDMGRF